MRKESPASRTASTARPQVCTAGTEAGVLGPIVADPVIELDPGTPSRLKYVLPPAGMAGLKFTVPLLPPLVMFEKVLVGPA